MTPSDRKYDFLLHRVFQYVAVIGILAVLGGGYWYWKNARAATEMDDNRPSFEAPLTHDLNLTAGQGSPTYSRADGADRRATATDFEGLIRPVKSDEARFEGARRVENLLAYSESFENAAWTSGSVSANVTTAPDGTNTADQVTITAVQSNRRQAITRTVNAGDRYVFSVWLKASTTSNVAIEIDRDGGTTFEGGMAVLALTDTWKRYSYTYTFSAAHTGLRAMLVRRTDDPTVIYAWGAQLEEVTGQSNQNPSDYVSVGVKTSAPYHGAGVDGVKYFDTENGNTVASNVVTEATGTAIATATLKGYLSEGARTNSLTNSEVIGSWSITDSSITTDATTAPDGRVTAEQVTQGTAGTAGINSNSPSFDAGAIGTASVFLKRGNNDWQRVTINGGSNQINAWFNLGNGTAGSTSTSGTGTLSESMMTDIGDGWYRCTVSGSFSSIQSANIFLMATTGDGITTRANNATYYAWGGQIELGARFASSYIPTTSASVTRASDSLQYPETGNFNDTTGTVSLETTPNWTGGAGWNANWVANSSDSRKLKIWHWLGSANHTGVDRSANNGATRNNTDPSLTLTQGTMIKLATKWDGTALRQFNNGALAASDTTLTLPYDSLANSLYIGSNSTIDHAFSSIRNVRAWKKALTDTELNNLTSLTQATSESATKKTTIKAPDNTGLVAYWPFEDGGGTRAEDASPAGANSGTLSNAPTWINGKFGKALDFNGTTQYMTVGDSATLRPSQTGSMSISAWVYNHDVGGEWRGILVKNGGSEYGIWRSATSPGKWHFRTGTPSEVINSTADAAVNAWSHLTMTFSVGGTLTAYVDGAPIGTKALPAGVPASSSSALSIGRNAGEYFDGLIDDVRIYDRVLTATEVTEIYQTTASAKLNASQNSQLTDGLVGLWSFNGADLSGTTAYDRSGQGNDGALTNGPTAAIGKVGQGLRFDGINDYVNVPNTTNLNPGTGNFTISAWIRVDSTPTDFRRLINKGAGSNYYAFVKFPGDKWKFELRDGTLSTGDLDFGSSTMTYGNWAHLVATVNRDTDLTTGYLDGVLKDTSSITGYATVSNTDYLSLGRSSIDASYVMDDVRIYNRALTQAEISALYNAGR